MSMFRTVTTDWVYNPHPLLNTKQRFVGPAWVAWLIVRVEGKRVPSVLQRLAAFIFKVSGAHYEIQDLTESEIAAKRKAAEFICLFEKTTFAESMARVAMGATFRGLSSVINTGPAPGLESTDAHAGLH